MHQVGRVAGLWRYPVKSMAAEELDDAHVSCRVVSCRVVAWPGLAWPGLAGDRRWAFIRGGAVRSGTPWLTISRRADMVHYRAWYAEPDRPDESSTIVRTPSGHEFDVVDPALAAELGDGVRVIKQDRGVFDAWAGPVLRVGASRMRIDLRDKRCAVVNVDP